MKQTIFKTLVVLISLVIFSCGPSKTDMMTEISKIEKNVQDSLSTVKQTTLDKLTEKYLVFAEKYPSDSINVQYLFKLTNMKLTDMQKDRLVKVVEKITANSSLTNSLKPKYLFLKATIYENNIKNLQKARYAYQELIEKYPNTKFAQDAKYLIEYLGKTPEQIFELWKEKGIIKDDSVKVNV